MAAFFAISFSVFCILFGVGYADLYPGFYTNSCPGALTEIQKVVNETVAQDPRMGASLLRLHFHDCFVNGCDASVLLDNTLTFIGEKSSPPNANSLRGFGVIDTIKSKVDSFCGRPVVSCADILAVAARDSVVALGGPTWTVQLGRKDSLTASFVTAEADLPAPTSSLDSLKNAFAKKGLSETDMVALSGGHTIGMGQCNNYRTRVYTESNINSDYARSLRNNCPLVLGNSNLSPLDGTSVIFDNTYYKDLVNLKGLFHSDQELYNNGSTDSLVRKYSIDAEAFYADFKIAMVNLGNLSPPPGAAGEVRTNCRRTNTAFF